jgi:excisionase family DNA binding protein
VSVRRHRSRLTLQQAADRLGIHDQTLRRYIRRGLLRAFKTPSVSKFGGRYRILATDLEKFRARHLVGPDRIETPRIQGGEKTGNGKDRGARNSDGTPVQENLY